VHGVGAGELLIDPAGGAERLLPVRHLIRQPVTRLELQVGVPEHDEGCECNEGGCCRPTHHAVHDPANQRAQAIHKPIRRGPVARQRGLVADEEQAKQRQHQNDRDE
jgi:hypothetical protein